MTNVKALTSKVEGDINEIMEVIMDKMDKKAISEMSADEFLLMKAVFNLVDSTTALMTEYGRTLEEIDRKLDILIKD